MLFQKKESLISFFLSWDTSAPLTSLSLCAAFIPVRVSLFFVLKINLQTNNSVFSPLFLIRLLAGLVRGRAQVSNLDLAESFCSQKKEDGEREILCCLFPDNAFQIGWILKTLDVTRIGLVIVLTKQNNSFISIR